MNDETIRPDNVLYLRLAGSLWRSQLYETKPCRSYLCSLQRLLFDTFKARMGIPLLMGWCWKLDHDICKVRYVHRDGRDGRGNVGNVEKDVLSNRKTSWWKGPRVRLKADDLTGAVRVPFASCSRLSCLCGWTEAHWK